MSASFLQGFSDWALELKGLAGWRGLGGSERDVLENPPKALQGSWACKVLEGQECPEGRPIRMWNLWVS